MRPTKINLKSVRSLQRYFRTLLLLSTMVFLFLIFNIQREERENYAQNEDLSINASFSPEQIHIAIGNLNSQVVIVWSTKSNSEKEVLVNYGINSKHLNLKQSGSARLLSNNGWTQFINYVTLSDLPPNTKIWYRACSVGHCSELYYFKSLPKTGHSKIRAALFGDLGLVNGRSIPSLIKSSTNDMFDIIFHLGDIAYNMNGDNGKIGDYYLRRIEPFASRIPYMVIPGNKEYECSKYCPSDNGLNYETRFKMPGLEGNDNSHYTLKIGNALFIIFSTELYYENESKDETLPYASEKRHETQKKWLISVLTRANKRRNKFLRPWIITLAHRPIYCSAAKGCPNGMLKIVNQNNNNNSGILELDQIFKKFKVDLAFWGHHHYYERMWPVFNKTVYKNGTQMHIYKNPEATVHIISGSAGNAEVRSEFAGQVPEWSAVQHSSYGYTRITVYNRTHIYLEQIDVDKNDQVIDYLWIVKDLVK